jgi:FKBP-type peptidyl-prolyl cis-trans isomerase
MNRITGMAVAAVCALLLAGCNKPSAEAEQVKQQGAAFLAENASKPGVIKTASGLQYLVLQEGQGAMPAATSEVTVNYRGSLIDGTEFDSGEAVSFPLDRVIPGWTEGLQLMKEGAKYRFFIPADLAYGERGAGGRIPPNAALVFEVELVKAGQPR